MLKAIRFRNFRVLRDARLPLARCTVLVGPNGSGKSTALVGLKAVREPGNYSHENLATFGRADEKVEVLFEWDDPLNGVTSHVRWLPNKEVMVGADPPPGGTTEPQYRQGYQERMRVFTLAPNAIVAPVHVQPNLQLGEDGTGLAGVLDALRDKEPELFQLLNSELGRWLPEFDQIAFDVVGPGAKRFMLRTRHGRMLVPAQSLSDGVVISLAILTLAYLPDAPSLACFEEIDRGIHPRLLRNVQDALYRLSYPESCGEHRRAVQTLVTTHSPYFLDLFRDHPEEVVICSKGEQGADFTSLAQHPHIHEILNGSQLGDIWYSGILGGVPVGT